MGQWLSVSLSCLSSLEDRDSIHGRSYKRNFVYKNFAIFKWFGTCCCPQVSFAIFGQINVPWKFLLFYPLYWRHGKFLLLSTKSLLHRIILLFPAQSMPHGKIRKNISVEVNITFSHQTSADWFGLSTDCNHVKTL